MGTTGEGTTSGGRAPAAATFLAVLGPSLAFSIAQVDPLLLSLNLATVSRELDVPADAMGTLAGASTLVVAAAVLAVGGLGDRYGLKRLLMIGLTANVVVNLLAAAAPNYQLLLLVRFLDGLSLTSLIGLSLALLTVSVPAESRPTAIGLMMAINTVLYGLTPLVTGFVVDAFGWRSLFLVTPPLAVVALVLTARYTTQPPRQAARRLDVLGVLLFGVALLGLVYGVGHAQDGLTQPRVVISLGGALVAVLVFLLHERRTTEPALDLGLFKKRAFSVAVAAVITLNLVSAGMGTVLGQFGGDVLGLSSERIGLLYLPGTLLVAGASLLAGRTVAKRTARPVLVVGLLTLMTSGLVMAGLVSPTMAVSALVVATWLTNLGAFVTATGTSDTVVSHAPSGKEGSVAAIHPAFAMTGYALGPTIYLLLLRVLFQKEWMADAESRGVSLQEAQDSVDAAVAALATSGSHGYDPSLVRHASGLSLEVDYTNAVSVAFLIVSIVPLVVAVLAMFLMPRRRR